MTLLERDEQMREEGRKEGLKEGEDLMAKLISLLLADGLVSDVEKAAADPNVRDTLLRKYHLV